MTNRTSKAPRAFARHLEAAADLGRVFDSLASHFEPVARALSESSAASIALYESLAKAPTPSRDH